MKLILPILLLSFVTCCFSQSDYVAGQIYKIEGLCTDNNNHEKLPMLFVEIYSNNELISIGTSDFDGKFLCKFCSNKLKDDSITIKFTGKEYQQKTYNFKILSDTLIHINLSADPKKEWTKERLFEYTRTFISECGTDEISKEYELNELYRHCDGRIKNFREIKIESLNEWELIE